MVRQPSRPRRCSHRRRQVPYPAGFTVHLAITAPAGATGIKPENRQVELAGCPRRPVGGREAGLSPADQEWAAGRIARLARPAQAARLLAALAHPQRICILLKLLGGEATHRLLCKATGLKAGPLYHHLRELRGAGLIGPKIRDLYVLTAAGRRAILAALAIELICR